MATNFDILIHRNGDSVHLKLRGDFDGQAARRLLDTLIQFSRASLTIFIHTNSLDRIAPGGLNEFRRDLSRLTGNSLHVVFTGEKASTLSAAEN